MSVAGVVAVVASGQVVRLLTLRQRLLIEQLLWMRASAMQAATSANMRNMSSSVALHSVRTTFTGLDHERQCHGLALQSTASVSLRSTAAAFTVYTFHDLDMPVHQPSQRRGRPGSTWTSQFHSDAVSLQLGTQ